MSVNAEEEQEAAVEYEKEEEAEARQVLSQREKHGGTTGCRNKLQKGRSKTIVPVITSL